MSDSDGVLVAAELGDEEHPANKLATRQLNSGRLRERVKNSHVVIKISSWNLKNHTGWHEIRPAAQPLPSA